MYKDQVDSHDKSHVQSQEFVPSSNVDSDISDVKSPSGNVVSEFSERSIFVRRPKFVNVPAAILDIPADFKLISSSELRLVNSPEGMAVSRKSALIVIFTRFVNPENTSDDRGPMIPPSTVNSSRLVKLESIPLEIPVKIKHYANQILKRPTRECE